MLGIRSSLQCSKRLFSSSALRPSHIGSAPIFLPKEVQYKITDLREPTVLRKGKKLLKLDRTITINGPKGELEYPLPDFLEVQPSGEDKLIIKIKDEKDKQQKSLWGTSRSIINNHVTGVTEGHIALLKLVGTGYRAQIEDRPDGTQFVSMKVGASIPQGLVVPEGLKASSPVVTRVVIEGANKQQVNLFAACLRKFRPPEPYKGKGIYVNDETIKIKDKKIK